MQALDSILISFYTYFSGPSHRTAIRRAPLSFCFARAHLLSKMCKNNYTVVLILPLNSNIMGTHMLCGAVKNWYHHLRDKGCTADTPVNSEEGRQSCSKGPGLALRRSSFISQF